MDMHWIAPAKINLSLHIIGQREDGYHLLESLVVHTMFGDEITYMSSDDPFHVTIDHDSLLPDVLRLPSTHDPRDNLAHKASMKIAESVAIKNPTGHLHIHKKIPCMAGMGGGSSDAASTLLHMKQLWDRQGQLSNHDIKRMALELGADVMACLTASPKWMCGIGEQVHDAILMEDFPRHIVITNPGIGLSTPRIFKAYQAYKGDYTGAMETEKMARPIDIKDVRVHMRNDLQSAAIYESKAIENMVSIFRATDHCRLYRMSGSGATIFGLYDDEQSALSAHNAIRQQGFWSMISALHQ